MWKANFVVKKLEKFKRLAYKSITLKFSKKCRVYSPKFTHTETSCNWFIAERFNLTKAKHSTPLHVEIRHYYCKIWRNTVNIWISLKHKCLPSIIVISMLNPSKIVHCLLESVTWIYIQIACSLFTPHALSIYIYRYITTTSPRSLPCEIHGSCRETKWGSPVCSSYLYWPAF